MISWWVSILFIGAGGFMILLGAALGGFLVFKGAGRQESFIAQKKGEVFTIPEPDMGFPSEPSEEEKSILERSTEFLKQFSENNNEA